MNVVKILMVLGLLAVGVAVIANYTGGGSGANTAQQADEPDGSGDATPARRTLRLHGRNARAVTFGDARAAARPLGYGANLRMLRTVSSGGCGGLRSGRREPEGRHAP